jgi:hypothetical protein
MTVALQGCRVLCQLTGHAGLSLLLLPMACVCVQQTPPAVSVGYTYTYGPGATGTVVDQSGVQGLPFGA